jgi:hypothetical protein
MLLASFLNKRRREKKQRQNDLLDYILGNEYNLGWLVHKKNSTKFGRRSANKPPLSDVSPINTPAGMVK